MERDREGQVKMAYVIKFENGRYSRCFQEVQRAEDADVYDTYSEASNALGAITGGSIEFLSDGSSFEVPSLISVDEIRLAVCVHCDRAYVVAAGSEPRTNERGEICDCGCELSPIRRVVKLGKALPFRITWSDKE